jgi:hypothetical protein
MTYLKLARTGEKIPTHSTAFESSNRYTLNWTTALVERVTPRPRRVLTFMKRSLFKLCLHPVNASIVRPNQVLLARNCYLVNAPVSNRLESGFIGPSCVLSDANDIYGPPPWKMNARLRNKSTWRVACLTSRSNKACNCTNFDWSLCWFGLRRAPLSLLIRPPRHCLCSCQTHGSH